MPNVPRGEKLTLVNVFVDVDNLFFDLVAVVVVVKVVELVSGTGLPFFFVFSALVLAEEFAGHIFLKVVRTLVGLGPEVELVPVEVVFDDLHVVVQLPLRALQLASASFDDSLG